MSPHPAYDREAGQKAWAKHAIRTQPGRLNAYYPLQRVMNRSDADLDDQSAARSHARKVRQLHLLALAGALPPAVVAVWEAVAPSGAHSGRVIVFLGSMLFWVLAWPFAMRSSLRLAREVGWKPVPIVLNVAAAAAWLYCLRAVVFGLIAR